MLLEAGFSINKIVPRMAKSLSLIKFYDDEQMRGVNDVFRNEIGWCVQAVKMKDIKN